LQIVTDEREWQGVEVKEKVKVKVKVKVKEKEEKPLVAKTASINMYCPNCSHYDEFSLEEVNMAQLCQCLHCTQFHLLAFWGYSCAANILTPCSYNDKQRYAVGRGAPLKLANLGGEW
jgi:hypothetical protein